MSSGGHGVRWWRSVPIDRSIALAFSPSLAVFSASLSSSSCAPLPEKLTPLLARHFDRSKINLGVEKAILGCAA